MLTQHRHYPSCAACFDVTFFLASICCIICIRAPGQGPWAMWIISLLFAAWAIDLV